MERGELLRSTGGSVARPKGCGKRFTGSRMGSEIDQR